MKVHLTLASLAALFGSSALAVPPVPPPAANLKLIPYLVVNRADDPTQLSVVFELACNQTFAQLIRQEWTINGLIHTSFGGLVVEDETAGCNGTATHNQAVPGGADVTGEANHYYGYEEISE